MVDDHRTLLLGPLTMTVINVGDFQVRYANEWSNVSPSELAAQTTANLAGPVRMPVQCFHIAWPGMSVLVDASIFEVPRDHPYFIPGYRPPPGLLAGLAQAHIQRETVTHVIITHGHADHFQGVTHLVRGNYVPSFPNAGHYFGRADWDSMQPRLQDPMSVESHTLGMLQAAGLLELVEGDRDLGGGLQIISAPGETPGHQIVRVHFAEHTLYFLGDLYHHIVEVEHPSWMVNWNDFEANTRSRQVLTNRALQESALLFATHIPTVGRPRRTAAGIRWETV
jgi:glyoxylase-like metal-dependent hydrolase (beta-lactamase superfamily II)